MRDSEADTSDGPSRNLVRYSEYKHSDNEWIGEIPVHWHVNRTKTLLCRNDGGVWGDRFDDGGVIVLRSTEQNADGRWRIETPARRHLAPSEYHACRLICDDLVVTKSSGSTLHIGKTSIVTREVASLNCCYSNFMQRLRVKAECNTTVLVVCAEWKTWPHTIPLPLRHNVRTRKPQC